MLIFWIGTNNIEEARVMKMESNQKKQKKAGKPGKIVSDDTK